MNESQASGFDFIPHQIDELRRKLEAASQFNPKQRENSHQNQQRMTRKAVLSAWVCVRARVVRASFSLGWFFSFSVDKNV
jgi:hypothetical protein